MDQKIIDYIMQNKVLTIATCFSEEPYCASCFYAFDEASKNLIFLSEDSTRHIKEALQNENVAGTINDGVTTVAKIRGIQFTGTFIVPDEEQQKLFYKVYYDKFTFAKIKPSKVWSIKLNTVKMTDNTLGFGKKIRWEV